MNAFEETKLTEIKEIQEERGNKWRIASSSNHWLDPIRLTDNDAWVLVLIARLLLFNFKHHKTEIFLAKNQQIPLVNC